MSRQRYFEILCAVVLVVFIGAMLAGNAGSSKTAQEVFTPVTEQVDLDSLMVRDNTVLVKEFSFGEKDVENVIYISSDSVMEVRELLLVEAKTSEDVQRITELIKNRVEAKKALFKNYAPEQSALLENFVLIRKGKFIFYTVYDEPEKLARAFKKAL